MLFSIPARVMSMQITLQSTDNESIQLIVFYLQKLPDETKGKKDKQVPTKELSHH